MATLLFAHELGLGFGHLNRLLTIAEHFKVHDLVFGVPNPQRATPLIFARLGPSVKILPIGEWRYAPVPPLRLPAGSPWTLADMLYEFGLGEQERVADVVSTWASRLDAIRPDLVVADFAPMMRIATADRVPTVVIGNGYTVPPSMSPLPGLRADQRMPSGASCARETAVLSSVNAAQARLGSPQLQRVADLFQGDDTFPAALEVLDPYHALRTRPILQPFNIPDIPLGPAHDERTGPHIFCYLHPDHPGLDPLLTALNGLARPSLIFVRDLDPQTVARHCAPQVSVHQGQADFRAILPQTRLLIHHAGPGTAAAGLLAGLPQLLLPSQFEQELATACMAELDCAVGLSVEATADSEALRGIIETLLTSRRAQEAALAQASHLQARRTSRPELEVVAACRARLQKQAVARH